MATIPDRPNAALVVIDVQNGVMADAHARDEVIGTIGGLVTRARAAAVPVVWVQHADDELVRESDDWALVAELVPDPDEARIHKGYRDSFEATDLEERLADLRVGHLFVTGAQTDFCVRSTLHGAFTRGYDVTLVADAHTTEDLSEWGAPPPDQVIAHTNLYWVGQSAPGRRAGVTPSADVDFGASAG